MVKRGTLGEFNRFCKTSVIFSSNCQKKGSYLKIARRTFWTVCRTFVRQCDRLDTPGIMSVGTFVQPQRYGPNFSACSAIRLKYRRPNILMESCQSKLNKTSSIRITVHHHRSKLQCNLINLNISTTLSIQWRSSAPKSGGGGTNFFSQKSGKAKKKKKKVTAV